MIARSRLLALFGVIPCLFAACAVTPAFAAEPAWSLIGASGPTHLPPQQSETQKIFVDAEGGTFTLTVKKIVGTGVGKPQPGLIGIVEFEETSGTFAVGQEIEGVGISPGTKIQGFSPGQPCTAASPCVLAPTKQVQVFDAPKGPIIAIGGTETTTPLDFDADPAEIESALEALPLVNAGGGGVEVSGGPGGALAEHPYSVTFNGGPLANTNVAELKPDSSQLTGSNRSANVLTTVLGGPGTGEIAIYPQNIGGLPTVGQINMSVTLPAGVTTTKTPQGAKGSETIWSCTPTGAGAQSFTCTSTAVVQPGSPAVPVVAPVEVGPAASGTKDVQASISGGGVLSPVNYSMPLTVSSQPAKPGVQSFSAGAYDENGVPDARAGAHPYTGSTGILLNTHRNSRGIVVPVGEFKDIEVELPTGFLGNPIAVPQCPETDVGFCKTDPILGRAEPLLNFGSGAGGAGVNKGVYNVEAPFGFPSKFYFDVVGLPIEPVGSVRSDSDYGLNVASINTAQAANVYGSFFTFWGSPADPAHDDQRCEHNNLVTTCSPPVPSTVEETAFLTNPTNCAEQSSIAGSNGGSVPVRLNVTLWQNPGEVFRTSAGVPPVTGCENLKFEAGFTFEPSDTKADSPASFRTSLTIPSEGLTDPDKLATPPIKQAIVQLPKGVVLNASGADGLQACSLEQIGFLGKGFPMPNPIRFNKAANQCPDASKIGTGELKTALLTDPLQGALYLAAQGDGNPYGSLFAIYLVIEDPRHGIFIKLPGRVDPSETDGQMTVTFENLPQLPFSRLDLNLKGGNRSALASPTTCGNYVTTATNTPWSAPESGPPTVSANGFAINQGPNGQPCANTPGERPFDIGWSAGAESTKAGADGPFHMRITRPDGSQELDSLEMQTPEGLSASLKGIPYCSGDQIRSAEQRTGKEELSNSSCPAASKVGTLTTGAGSGPSPFYVEGNLYLAGPYKGAPISVVAVTPAVAGPFDLGNVVVRAAVNIDRTTAQVTAKSDPIPQLLKGVVLRIKDVRIKLDRKDWTLNPTSCDASAVKLKATGNSGASTEKSTRFQVGGCGELPFKPSLKAHLTGGTKRGAHPAFTATVDFPAGHANTKDVQVTLPHSEFLDQAHINTICTRVQAAANNCPQGAIYGFAEAESPLIDGKLTGPVFLKSSDHQLPDLAIALKGPDHQPVEVEFQGRIDSIKAQIRNTIEGLPDVPVTKFVLKMKGGRKGLLVNSRNLCNGKVTKMTVKMVGQNNKTSESRPPLTRKCKGKKAAKKGKSKRVAAKHSRLRALSSIW